MNLQTCITAISLGERTCVHIGGTVYASGMRRLRSATRLWQRLIIDEIKKWGITFWYVFMLKLIWHTIWCFMMFCPFSNAEVRISSNFLDYLLANTEQQFLRHLKWDIWNNILMKIHLLCSPFCEKKYFPYIHIHICILLKSTCFSRLITHWQKETTLNADMSTAWWIQLHQKLSVNN